MYEKMSVVVDKFLNIQPQFLGIIPQDDSVSKAVMLQKPISLAFPASAAAKAFEVITDKLLEGNEGGEEGKKGITVFFSNLIRSKLKKSRSKKEEK